VSDHLLVHVVEAEQDLLDNFGCYCLRYFLHLHHLIQHVSPRHQLCDNIVVLFIFKKCVYFWDVGVVSVLEDFELIHHEVFVDWCLTHFRFVDDLDGAGCFGFAVDARPNSSERTLSKLLRRLVIIRNLVNSLEAAERLQVQHPFLVLLVHYAAQHLVILNDILD